MSAFAGSRRSFRVNVRVNVGVKKMTEQCGRIRFETSLFRVNVRVSPNVKKMTEQSIFAFTFTLTLSFVDRIGEVSNFF